MRMEIPPSLCCHPRLYPCHQLSQKVKSLKFCLLSFLDAGQCQAVKQSNTESLSTIISVPLFSSSEHSTIIFLLLLVSSVFNRTLAYRWLLEIEFSLQSKWYILCAVAQQRIQKVSFSSAAISTRCVVLKLVRQRHFYNHSIYNSHDAILVPTLCYLTFNSAYLKDKFT